MWSRRRVIFVGAAGALAVTAAVVIPRLRSGAGPVNAKALVQSHSTLLSALAAAVLGPALPAKAEEQGTEIQRVLDATAALIANLPAPTRAELSDLFGLLELKAARMLLGYSGDWENADRAAVTQFLAGLRDSSIAMKQQAYFAFHDLLMGAFYSAPHTWQATGYPGPPKLA